MGLSGENVRCDGDNNDDEIASDAITVHSVHSHLRSFTKLNAVRALDAAIYLIWPTLKNIDTGIINAYERFSVGHVCSCS